MRAMRLSLVGMVILVLLGGTGGTVLAQEPIDDAVEPHSFMFVGNSLLFWNDGAYREFERLAAAEEPPGTVEVMPVVQGGVILDALHRMSLFRVNRTRVRWRRMQRGGTTAEKRGLPTTASADDCVRHPRISAGAAREPVSARVPPRCAAIPSPAERADRHGRSPGVPRAGPLPVHLRGRTRSSRLVGGGRMARPPRQARRQRPSASRSHGGTGRTIDQPSDTRLADHARAVSAQEYVPRRRSRHRRSPGRDLTPHGDVEWCCIHPRLE
jgi:hypothetical protein